MSAPTALVIGGGIAGLLAAHRLAQRGYAVTLAEATSVLGGALSARYLDVPSVNKKGAPQAHTLELDGGAEAYAVRGTAVAALLEELGLHERVIAPQIAQSWIHTPQGSLAAPALGVLGIPGDLDAPDTLAALSPEGRRRAAEDREADLERWARLHEAGERITVGELVEDRLGTEVLQRLVTPVVAGVHSADPFTVDVERVAPGLVASMLAHGGLAAGVAAQRAQHAPGSAVAGLDGGMHRLTDRLLELLRDADVTVLRGVRVAALKRLPEGGWWAQISDRDDEVVRGIDAERVVLAVDGVSAWSLLAPASRGALAEDAGPAHSAGVALVTLVVDHPELDAAPRGSGVLVAEGTGVAAKALTHATAKWAWLAEVVRRELPSGDHRHPHRHVLRLSYGRHGGDDQLGFRSTDEELTEQAVTDAAALTGVGLRPEDVAASMVVRWRACIPPQAGTSRDAMNALTRWSQDQAGLDVVGAWVDGTGLAAIVAGVERRVSQD
ncbi:MAG: FAD-dependent oxidoreductase [Micrococcus sp.]|nr:FAD-dependent oxidoreductase [Micrococcus sp.]